MNSPTMTYGAIGLVAGAIMGYLYAGPNLVDVLIGAFFGALIALVLAFMRTKLWDRQ